MLRVSYDWLLIQALSWNCPPGLSAATQKPASITDHMSVSENVDLPVLVDLADLEGLVAVAFLGLLRGRSSSSSDSC